MVGMTYNVNFHFIGISEEDLGESRKQRIINEFVSLRHIFIERANSLYDRWNAAYTDPISGEDDDAYNSYIREKQQPHIDAINKVAKTMGFAVRLDHLPQEGCDICGVFKLKNKKSEEIVNCRVYFTLSPA